jgi:CHASE3 domain sensor protein
MFRWRYRGPLLVFAQGSSLRRRVAYSLALVRMILIPVLLLAIYYLFSMGSIVDRIATVDAPAWTFAEQASLEMSEARRTERTFLLIQDPAILQANQESMGRLRQNLEQIQELEPQEQEAIRSALDAIRLYQERIVSVPLLMQHPEQTVIERVQQVVNAYERDLNSLLRNARREHRSPPIDLLRTQVESFDAEITKTVEARDPIFQQVTADLQASSEQILRSSSELARLNWERVQNDHLRARQLVRRAEWVLTIVSGCTLLLSVWISFILPREVVQPLVSLKEAVDHATAGNLGIEFHIQGEGEVVQLANSVQKLICSLPKTNEQNK